MKMLDQLMSGDTMLVVRNLDMDDPERSFLFRLSDDARRAGRRKVEYLSGEHWLHLGRFGRNGFGWSRMMDGNDAVPVFHWLHQAAVLGYEADALPHGITVDLESEAPS